MDIRLNIDQNAADKIVACIKSIAGNMSVDDILEIVLMSPKRRFTQELLRSEKDIDLSIEEVTEILLEGKPRSEYEEYRNVFNRFITGPAVEGREIVELTEKYQKFYEVIKSTPLKVQESNKLEDALYGVAIEAEMQGFIYGFKMFDALLNKQLAKA